MLYELCCAGLSVLHWSNFTIFKIGLARSQVKYLIILHSFAMPSIREKEKIKSDIAMIMQIIGFTWTSKICIRGSLDARLLFFD